VEHLGSTLGTFHIFTSSTAELHILTNFDTKSLSWQLSPYTFITAWNELRTAFAFVLVLRIDKVLALALPTCRSRCQPPVVSSALGALLGQLIQCRYFIIAALALVSITLQTMVQVVCTGLAFVHAVHHEANCARRAPILITSGAIRALSASLAFFVFESKSSITSEAFSSFLKCVSKPALLATRLFRRIAGLALSLIIDQESIRALLALARSFLALKAIGVLARYAHSIFERKASFTLSAVAKQDTRHQQNNKYTHRHHGNTRAFIPPNASSGVLVDLLVAVLCKLLHRLKML